MSKIQLPKYGDAAGDGKGELLRNATIMYNESIATIVDWITGSPNTESLMNTKLGITRGGTGASTAQGARLNLGLFIDTNNEVVFGSRAISVYDGVVLDHDQTVKPTINKVGIGNYTITNVPGYALNGFKFRFPKDDLGTPLVIPVITFAGTVCTVKTYKPKFLNGVWSADTTVPLNIPASRCVDISVK